MRLSLRLRPKYGKLVGTLVEMIEVETIDEAALRIQVMIEGMLLVSPVYDGDRFEVYFETIVPLAAGGDAFFWTLLFDGKISAGRFALRLWNNKLDSYRSFQDLKSYLSVGEVK